MKNKVIYLTTKDNPWSPFTNFNEWYIFDITNKYNCCEIVARLSDVSRDMTEKEKSAAIEEAIKTFVEEEPTKNYTFIEEETDEVPV